MAAITFNTAHQKEQVRKQLETALAAYREMLDAFVSNQMRQAAAEAEHARPRQAPRTTSPAERRAMTAMQLTCTDPSPRQSPGRSTAAIGQDGERSGILPADKPATVTAQFRPLDPGIVNETIPAFFIGRNKEGFWVARDVNGQIGGIFLLENSAAVLCKTEQRAGGMCNHISVREVRTRPGKQRQSVRRATWIVEARGEAPTASDWPSSLAK